MASKKKKRITSSLLHHHSKSKTYNMDSNSIVPETQISPCPTLNEKGSSSTAIADSASHISSVNESMFTAGRTFHHVENSAYWFPNDDEEMDRLIGQHFALKTLFGGNISSHILNGLDMEKEGTLVLDLGCGPGTWIMDVATEYPSSQFIGVDMCDVFPNNIRPPNVSFQVGNALGRLPFSDNTFDFVNIRLFIIALKKHEWPIVISEAYRVLKPGGYLQMVECGMLERGNDFVKNAGAIFKQMIEAVGQESYIAHKLDTLMQSVNLSVLHFENKDVYLGKPDPLSKEFLWDACTIFKTAQAALQEPLGYNSENYSQFLDTLYKELQKEPDAIWSFSICIGRK